MLPKMSAYRKDFVEAKYMSFLIKKNDKVLEKYNEIWDKLSNTIKQFDSEPVCNKKYLRKNKTTRCLGYLPPQ